MISSDLINNLKYIGKLSLVFLIVFLLLKFIINLKPYEALLLSLIIIVSIIIIENIISINDIASDPLNCDQCKVSTIDVINSSKNSCNNIVPNPLVETEMKEHFYVGDLLSNAANAVNAGISAASAALYNQPSTTASSNGNQIVQIPQQPTTGTSSGTNNMVMQPATISTITADKAKAISPEKQDGTRTLEYNSKYWECKAVLKGGDSNGYMMVVEDGTVYSCPSIPIDASKSRETFRKVSGLEGFANLESETTNNLNTYLEQQQQINNSIVNKINIVSQENVSLDDVIPEVNSTPTTTPTVTPTSTSTSTSTSTQNGDKVSSDIEFDQTYVQYQKDGTQAAERVISEKQNEFKMAIGNQEVVKQYLQDGQKYYNRIYNESASAPSDTDAMRSEMKYGDFNYISPLNKGMTNRMYTYIAPNNWYPINPHPPVCVTNKNCTTVPITISNGNEYMQWASLDDFDNARRFTGNMGINLEYIKNVLNNDNAY